MMVIFLFELLNQDEIEVEYDGMHFIQFYQILLFIFFLLINKLLGSQGPSNIHGPNQCLLNHS